MLSNFVTNDVSFYWTHEFSISRSNITTNTEPNLWTESPADAITDTISDNVADPRSDGTSIPEPIVRTDVYADRHALSSTNFAASYTITDAFSTMQYYIWPYALPNSTSRDAISDIGHATANPRPYRISYGDAVTWSDTKPVSSSFFCTNSSAKFWTNLGAFAWTNCFAYSDAFSGPDRKADITSQCSPYRSALALSFVCAHSFTN
jgi:hypothetical protein